MVRAARLSLLMPAFLFCLQVAATTTPEKLTALQASLQEFSKSKDKPEGTLFFAFVKGAFVVVIGSGIWTHVANSNRLVLGVKL